MEVSRPESEYSQVLLQSSTQYGFVYVDESRSGNLVGKSLRKITSLNNEIQIREGLETNVAVSKGAREHNSNWEPAVSERAFAGDHILRQVRVNDEGRPIVASCMSFIEVESSGEAMIDAVDCRQREVRHMGAVHHQNGGRDQPVSYVVGQNSGDMSNAVYSGGSNNGSTYTMLTPLKPLPSISTVSERLGSNGAGTFAYMHDCNGGINSNSAVNGSYHSYKYDTSEMHMPTNCNNYQSLPVANSVSSRLSNAGYMSTAASQYSTFGQPANCHVHHHPVKSELMGSMMAMNSMSCYDVPSGYANNSRIVPSLPVETQVEPSSGELTHQNVESMQVMHGSCSPQTTGIMSPLHQSRAVIGHNRQVMLSQHRVGSPDQPSSSTDLQSSVVKCTRPVENEGSSCGSEEISTRDVAQRVSNELKRYSIPQAVFAQRVLGRSQGTLSDLLRNPKPWSKLKSGRETFRRMWKWLQEPEYQRMASLRSMASSMSASSFCSPEVEVVAGSGNVTTATPTSKHQSSTGCKRSRDVLTLCSSNSAPSTVTSHSSSTPATHSGPPQKKPRMVFTEIQRRTLVAIFREIKRPSKEIQSTIAEQLGLKVSTVVNFFMNARRRSVDKYLEEVAGSGSDREMSTVSSTASTVDDLTSRQ